MVDRQGPGRGYEDPEVDTPKVMIAGFALLIACAVALVIAILVFRVLNAREAGRQPQPSTLAGRTGGEEPPEPRLQTAPFDDVKAMRAEEEKQLTSYGWIDRKAGVVRLPIERAIDLVAERGLPSWAAPAASSSPGPGGAPAGSGASRFTPGAGSPSSGASSTTRSSAAPPHATSAAHGVRASGARPGSSPRAEHARGEGGTER